MKNLLNVFVIAILGMTLHSVSAQKSSLEIPAKSSMEIDYADVKMYQLQLKNNGSKGIEIRVENKKTGDFVRGFGLGTFGKVYVNVEQENKIIFNNTSKKVARLTIEMSEMDAKQVQKSNEGLISFKLINPSSKSIPLIIPNVMNPNLSPKSTSGVDLAIGQELYFRNNGKRYVLFTVSDAIKEGQKVDVYELLQNRKKELGLN